MPILTEEERVGTTLGGKYRIRRILGHGGMAVIYEAVHLRSGRPVAVKILHHEFASHPDVSARFFTEARATAGLKHPNIVDVLDVGQEPDGTAYLVLELLRGETWQDRIDRGKVSLSECLRLLGPVMEALEEVHARGVVHRDLKPENLFVHQEADGREVAKLLDFGLARVTASADEAHRTVTGTVLGTPTFMAPEQASAKKEIGPGADVWAMAIVLSLSLTGERPYQSQGIAVVLEIVKTGPRPIEEIDPSLPPELCTWIGKALRMDPAERPSMRELFEGLCAVCGREAEEIGDRTLFRAIALEELELWGTEEIEDLEEIGEVEETREEDLDTVYDPNPSGASVDEENSSPGSGSEDHSVAVALGLSLDGEVAPVTDPAILLASLERGRKAAPSSAPEAADGEASEPDPEEAQTQIHHSSRKRPGADAPLPPLSAPVVRDAEAPAQEASESAGSPSTEPEGGALRLILALTALAILALAVVVALVLSG